MSRALTICLELQNNKKVREGLNNCKDFFTDNFDRNIISESNWHDVIVIVLQGLDFGRFDSEGDRYIIDLLNIEPADFLHWRILDFGS